jgi:hypothetical protein
MADHRRSCGLAGSRLPQVGLAAAAEAFSCCSVLLLGILMAPVSLLGVSLGVLLNDLLPRWLRWRHCSRMCALLLLLLLLLLSVGKP